MMRSRLLLLAAATAVIGTLFFSSVRSRGAPDEYMVMVGDTLSEIALRYGVSVEELAEANGIVDPDYILSGQVLLVPRAGENAHGASLVAGQTSGGSAGPSPRSLRPTASPTRISSWRARY
jgi:LysM repeat protein